MPPDPGRDRNAVASSSAGSAFGSFPTLGVGLLYNAALPEYLRDFPDSFDYLEIIPEMFWTDRGPKAPQRFVELSGWVEMLDGLSRDVPLVAHNIGLSLGSADYFDKTYPEHIAEWHERYGFHWHSDHLSFVRMTSADGHDHNAGLAVPVPYDYEVADLIVERIKAVQASVPLPFLIENNVYFIDVPDQDMTEPEFLNHLSRQTGCGVLLDLHNLYANARNHGFDAQAWLDELELDRVLEMHIAGGSELAGLYTDSHAGPCPEPVWDLLESALPRAPHVRGITFEFHDSYYPLLKSEGILRELDHARAIWRRHRPGP
jgi:uncharacterized protein (UPF0276 family)